MSALTQFGPTPPPSALQPARNGGGRVLLLDLLRLLAAVQMVQGHTIDAVLGAEFRHGPWHALWLSSRGLTSVVFLFVAGLAFGSAALSASPRPRTSAQPRRRLRRAGSLVLLGYALHLPLGLLAGPSAAEAARLLAAAHAVDILQCIGVSLAAVEALAYVMPNPRALRIASGVLALGLLAASPAVRALVPQGPFVAVLDYLSPRGGSLFPLFPWAAHLLLGVAASGVLLAGQGRSWRFAGAAVLVLGAGWLMGTAGASLAADHLTRLGWVLGCAALLSPLERSAASWPAWALRLPRETLFIYVFHVLLVYGDRVGLAVLVGPRLSPFAAAAVAVCVAALSFGCALGRARWRQVLRACHAAVRTALAGTTAPG